MLHDMEYKAAGVPPPARMRLAEALSVLPACGGEDVVLAVKPWSPDAAAVITTLKADGSLPDAFAREDYVFCLGAGVAREVMAAFEGASPPSEEVSALLLHYARHDAYPDWVRARHGGAMG